jgi:hypothetical protein
MLRGILLLVAAAALTACGSVPPPVVDMTGVDQAKHSRDLADCYDTMPAIAFGNYITKCMRDKGYTILVGH